MQNLIVVPTYNEREAITCLLAALEREVPEADVLVVDDSSPDGTAGLVRADPRYGIAVFLLERDVKDGIGGAYRAGFAWALNHDYEGIVQMDADLSHPPERVPALFAALESADVAVGSRYVTAAACPTGRCNDGYCPGRATGTSGPSCPCPPTTQRPGSKAFRASALRRIHVTSSTSNGNGFQVENTWRAERRGLRALEVPITFTDRTVGESKMSNDIVRAALTRVLVWRMHEIRAQAPHRAGPFGHPA
jgi:dolichol-phosphate mannosyltransferase